MSEQDEREEPGTGGDDSAPVPLYPISEAALDEIEAALQAGIDGIQGHNMDDSGLGTIGRAHVFVRATRERGPIPSHDDSEVSLIRVAVEKDRQRALAEQQRDFLVGQVDSLIQRLAGAHVAAGSFNMAAAQGFTQKEVMPINAVLAQIVQANSEAKGP